MFNFFTKQAKPVFKRYFSTQTSNVRSNLTAILTKHYHKEHLCNKTSFWTKLDQEQRIKLALAIKEPQSAILSYYKGLGCKNLGIDYYNDAINAFKRAAELDEAMIAPSAKQIASIYALLGNTKLAFEVMTNAYEDLIGLDHSAMENIKMVARMEQKLKG